MNRSKHRLVLEKKQSQSVRDLHVEQKSISKQHSDPKTLFYERLCYGLKTEAHLQVTNSAQRSSIQKPSLWFQVRDRLLSAHMKIDQSAFHIYFNIKEI